MNLYELEAKLNYEEIRAVMILKNRKWINHETGKMEVPSIERMQGLVSSLIVKINISKVDNTYATSGGFYAAKFKFSHSNEYSYQLFYTLK